VLRVGASHVREHAIECGARAVIVDKVVCEFGELIENHVLLVAGELGALVVDFLYTAFRPRRTDDVRGIRHPFRQPFEALAAHPRREHRHAAATENAGYGHAAAAVVSGGWPNGAVMRRVELAGHQPRHQTRIGGEHLVRANHGKAPAKQDDDRCLHAGQCLRQHHMPRHACSIPAVGSVEPVDTPEIFLIRLIRVDGFQAAPDCRGNKRRIG